MECLPHAKEPDHTQGRKTDKSSTVMGFIIQENCQSIIYMKATLKIDDYFAST